MDLKSTLDQLNEEFARLEKEKAELAEQQKKTQRLLDAQERAQTRAKTSDGKIELLLKRAVKLITNSDGDHVVEHQLKEHPEAVVNLATLIRNVEGNKI